MLVLFCVLSFLNAAWVVQDGYKDDTCQSFESSVSFIFPNGTCYFEMFDNKYRIKYCAHGNVYVEDYSDATCETFTGSSTQPANQCLDQRNIMYCVDELPTTRPIYHIHMDQTCDTPSDIRVMFHNGQCYGMGGDSSSSNECLYNIDEEYRSSSYNDRNCGSLNSTQVDEVGECSGEKYKGKMTCPQVNSAMNKVTHLSYGDDNCENLWATTIHDVNSCSYDPLNDFFVAVSCIGDDAFVEYYLDHLCSKKVKHRLFTDTTCAFQSEFVCSSAVTFDSADKVVVRTYATEEDCALDNMIGVESFVEEGVCYNYIEEGELLSESLIIECAYTSDLDVYVVYWVYNDTLTCESNAVGWTEMVVDDICEELDDRAYNVTYNIDCPVRDFPDVDWFYWEVFSNSTCTTFDHGFAYPCGECVLTTDGNFIVAACGSDLTIVTYYDDALCSDEVAFVRVFKNDVCSAGTNTLTMDSFPPNGTAYLELHSPGDVLCEGNKTTMVYYPVNECYDGDQVTTCVYTPKGTFHVTYSFNESNCAGPVEQLSIIEEGTCFALGSESAPMTKAKCPPPLYAPPTYSHVKFEVFDPTCSDLQFSTISKNECLEYFAAPGVFFKVFCGDVLNIMSYYNDSSCSTPVYDVAYELNNCDSNGVMVTCVDQFVPPTIVPYLEQSRGAECLDEPGFLALGDGNCGNLESIMGDDSLYQTHRCFYTNTSTFFLMAFSGEQTCQIVDFFLPLEEGVCMPFSIPDGGERRAEKEDGQMYGNIMFKGYCPQNPIPVPVYSYVSFNVLGQGDVEEIAILNEIETCLPLIFMPGTFYVAYCDGDHVLTRLYSDDKCTDLMMDMILDTDVPLDELHGMSVSCLESFDVSKPHTEFSVTGGTCDEGMIYFPNMCADLEGISQSYKCFYTATEIYLLTQFYEGAVCDPAELLVTLPALVDGSTCEQWDFNFDEEERRGGGEEEDPNFFETLEYKSVCPSASGDIPAFDFVKVTPFGESDQMCLSEDGVYIYAKTETCQEIVGLGWFIARCGVDDVLIELYDAANCQNLDFAFTIEYDTCFEGFMFECTDVFPTDMPHMIWNTETVTQECGSDDHLMALVSEEDTCVTFFDVNVKVDCLHTFAGGAMMLNVYDVLDTNCTTVDDRFAFPNDICVNFEFTGYDIIAHCPEPEVPPTEYDYIIQRFFSSATCVANDIVVSYVFKTEECTPLVGASTGQYVKAFCTDLGVAYTRYLDDKCTLSYDAGLIAEDTCTDSEEFTCIDLAFADLFVHGIQFTTDTCDEGTELAGFKFENNKCIAFEDGNSAKVDCTTALKFSYKKYFTNDCSGFYEETLVDEVTGTNCTVIDGYDMQVHCPGWGVVVDDNDNDDSAADDDSTADDNDNDNDDTVSESGVKSLRISLVMSLLIVSFILFL